MLSLRFVAILLLTLGGIAQAQISNATLVGTVTDSSGGSIVGATVEAKNEGTGVARSTLTDTSGEYTIPSLPAAHYSVTVKMAGFKTFDAAGIELQVAQRAMLNAVLEVGATEQKLTVIASVPMIETTSSSVGQVVDTAAVEHMPLNGRSFWQLTQLTPGATYTPIGQDVHSGGGSIRSQAVNVTINGTAPTWTGWYLDGANITETVAGGTLVQPNVDAIQEFKVEGADMPAEYGHSPNVINATLKSGSNTFHGTLYEFVRNSAFGARNFFFVPPPGSKETIEPLRRNQYGGTVGGPIRRNKTFFFADFERTDLREGQDFNNVVPSLAERTGDFSQLLASKKTILDPLSYQPFPGNLIPTSRIAPQAAFFLKYLPPPNVVQGATSRAADTNSLAQDQSRGDIRIDHQISSNTQLMGRYSINNNVESDPNPFPQIGFVGLYSRAQDAVASLTHVFGPRWFNETRFAYYRSLFLFSGYLQGTNFNQQAGVQGFNDTTSVYSFPQITLGTYATFTGSPSDQRPKSNLVRTWQYADGVVYSSGHHNLKFGAELMHDNMRDWNGSNSVGVFNFLGTYSGDAFGDFLLGYPDSVTRDYFKQLNGNRGNFWSAYAQDNFRVTPSLTVNAGLRFEINSFWNGIRGQESAINVVTGKLIIPSSIDPAVQTLTSYLLPLFTDRLQSSNQAGLPASIHPSERDFAPRIGLAWRPFGSNRWVIRSAYGIFYTFPDQNPVDNTVATVPFVAVQTVFNDRPPLAPTRTWGDFFLGQAAVGPNPNPGQPCSFGFIANSCDTPNVDSASLTFHTTCEQQWNFSLQRQLTSSTSFDIAYVGNKTTHANQNSSWNDPLPGPGAIQSRRPLPQWGVLTYVQFNENANYNALQAKFETRAWHNLTMLASYSYSRCIDYGSTEGSATRALYRLNRAVCDYDLPQTFVGSFDYLLPFGKGKHWLGSAPGWMNRIVGGWEFAGIQTLRSGLPFTPTINGDVANTGVGSQHPNLIGPPTLIGNVNCWFYISANAACASLAPNATSVFTVPAAYTYGTSGRNILRANGLNELDFTVMKTFALTESQLFEFRTEFFNIVNHPTFAAPATAINSSTGGQVSSTLNAARIIQFALKFRF